MLSKMEADAGKIINVISNLTRGLGSKKGTIAFFIVCKKEIEFRIALQ